MSNSTEQLKKAIQELEDKKKESNPSAGNSVPVQNKGPVFLRPSNDVAVDSTGHFTIAPIGRSKGKNVIINMHGYFGGFGINARDFNAQLDKKAKNATKIQVFINSGGGDLFEATAIFLALERHKAEIETNVEGVAASASTLVFQCGDVRNIPEGAHFMVHEVRGGFYGTASEGEAYLKLLRNANEALLSTYASSSGSTIDEMRDLVMNGDNWLKASEVVSLGLADNLVKLKKKVKPAVEPDNKIEVSWTKRSGKEDFTQAESIVTSLVAYAETKIESEDLVFDKWLLAIGVDKATASADMLKTLKASFDSLEESAVKATIQAFEANVVPAGGGGGGDNNLPDDPTPVSRADQIRREAHIENLCGPQNRLLAAEAIENNWDDDTIALRIEVADLRRAAGESSGDDGNIEGPDDIWGGGLYIPQNRATEAMTADGMVASLCMRLNGMTPEDLTDPFKGMSAQEVVEVRRTTNIKPMSEQLVDAAMKNLTGTLQEFCTMSNWLDGKARNPYQFDPHLSPQLSFSNVTFPAKFKEVCERGILAGFKIMSPKWSKFANAVSVSNFLKHDKYRMYGTGRWEKKPTCGELTQGEVKIDPAHSNQAHTEGQVLEICRDLIINNQIGEINKLIARFSMMGRMAPEFGVWDYVSDNLAGAVEFEFTYENMKALWECFCRKGEFELGGVDKDLCNEFKLAIEMGKPMILINRCDELKINEILNGEIQLCGTGAEDCEKIATLNAIKGMIQVCASSYMKPGHVVMLPEPNPMYSAIEVAFLNGRQLPVINRTSLANNKLGFGLQGYIDFGVNGTSNPFWCNQEILNTQAAEMMVMSANKLAIDKALAVSSK